jgi:hypothetical protein
MREYMHTAVAGHLALEVEAVADAGEDEHEHQVGGQ